MNIFIPPKIVGRNFLYNSNFDFFQKNGGNNVTVINTLSTYGPDRWYAKNSLGTNGDLTLVRSNNPPAGASGSVRLSVLNAPTSGFANGTELYQTLDNLTSLELYGKTASLGFLIKAIGNVTQIGLQFFYATSEIKVTTAIGAEKVFTVNSGGFIQCNLNGQALGTAMTITGVLGVRVRIVTVSTGNPYDFGNGFEVAQGMLNIGSSVADYRRMCNSIPDELIACQKFYEKTYSTTVNPATATALGARTALGLTNVNTTVFCGNTSFKVEKRVPPLITIYSPGGNSARMWNNAGVDSGTSTSSFDVGTSGFRYIGTTGQSAGETAFFHFTAEAEI